MNALGSTNIGGLVTIGGVSSGGVSSGGVSSVDLNSYVNKTLSLEDINNILKILSNNSINYNLLTISSQIPITNIKLGDKGKKTIIVLPENTYIDSTQLNLQQEIDNNNLNKKLGYSFLFNIFLVLVIIFLMYKLKNSQK